MKKATGFRLQANNNLKFNPDTTRNYIVITQLESPIHKRLPFQSLWRWLEKNGIAMHIKPIIRGCIKSELTTPVVMDQKLIFLAYNLLITNLISFYKTKLMIMKGSFWLIVFISSLTIATCKKESTPEQQIYFNSFESQLDTIGWRGYAFNFDNDVPLHGGKKSLSVSGGCIIPHAEYTIDPQSTDCYLKFRFWGKNLSNGGGVWLAVNKKGYGNISFDVTEKEWNLYESQDSLFCPANTSLTLGAIAGGISSSAILIDMIEITKLLVDP